MKRYLLMLYMLIFLNLFGTIEDKFDRYLESETEFQMLEEYRNIFSDSVPDKYYLIEKDEYFEFVGIYSISLWDDIYVNLEELFGSKGRVMESKSGIRKVFFENNTEKVVVKVSIEKVFIKYLKTTTNKSP